MNELNDYCNRKDENGYFYNDLDTRQARILRGYLVASLLGIDASVSVRFYWPNGICFREASFN